MILCFGGTAYLRIRALRCGCNRSQDKLNRTQSRPSYARPVTTYTTTCKLLRFTPTRHATPPTIALGDNFRDRARPLLLLWQRLFLRRRFILITDGNSARRGSNIIHRRIDSSRRAVIPRPVVIPRVPRHGITPIIHRRIYILIHLIQRPVGIAHACAGVGGFPWDHGLTARRGGYEKEIFSEGEAGAVRVRGCAGIARLDALGIDPVDV